MATRSNSREINLECFKCISLHFTRYIKTYIIGTCNNLSKRQIIVLNKKTKRYTNKFKDAAGSEIKLRKQIEDMSYLGYVL